MGNVLRFFCLPFEEPQYTILTSEETENYKSTEMPYINREEEYPHGYIETTYLANEEAISRWGEDFSQYNIQYNTVYSRLHGWD